MKTVSELLPYPLAAMEAVHRWLDYHLGGLKRLQLCLMALLFYEFLVAMVPVGIILWLQLDSLQMKFCALLPEVLVGWLVTDAFVICLERAVYNFCSDMSDWDD